MTGFPANYPPLKFTPFTGQLCCWNGEKEHKREKRRLDAQINRLIRLQCGLGQTSQGHPEDIEYRHYLIYKTECLRRSIKRALLI